MRGLETNDWIILNSIIYKIYTMENFNEMRRKLLEQLTLVVDFDSADFYLASAEDGKRLSNGITYNCDKDLSQVYEEIDYSRGIMLSGKSTIYRETDIISDEARIQTEYYQKVYRPNRWHYSLQMILARNKKFLGVITFYRLAGKEDFHYNDIFLLDMLKDHLAYRLDQNRKEDDGTGNKLTVAEAVQKYGLTRREHTILQKLMNGTENAEVCEELTISPNTLKKHILNIYRKLGINNRVQLFKMVKEKE